MSTSPAYDVRACYGYKVVVPRDVGLEEWWINRMERITGLRSEQVGLPQSRKPTCEGCGAPLSTFED